MSSDIYQRLRAQYRIRPTPEEVRAKEQEDRRRQMELVKALNADPAFLSPDFKQYTPDTAIAVRIAVALSVGINPQYGGYKFSFFKLHQDILEEHTTGEVQQRIREYFSRCAQIIASLKYRDILIEKADSDFLWSKVKLRNFLVMAEEVANWHVPPEISLKIESTPFITPQQPTYKTINSHENAPQSKVSKPDRRVEVVKVWLENQKHNKPGFDCLNIPMSRHEWWMEMNRLDPNLFEKRTKLDKGKRDETIHTFITYAKKKISFGFERGRD